MKTPFIFLIIAAFLLSSIGPLPVRADDLRLPVPGVMVHLSPPEDPPVLKGVTVYPNDPFKFDFILDRGESGMSKDQLTEESKKLVKYFLSSITTPEKDLWVNLSPYEKDRIIPVSFGQTDMGRDLLAEDYILKQITASLVYPEEEIGKQFWKLVYEEAAKKFGTTNIPVNTFNKVWIVPDHAKVYEHGNTAFVVKARLKVMLEQDYLALEKNIGIANHSSVNAFGSKIVREIVIPQLEKEVNEDKNFASLRQVYYSLILAVWFKKRMKDSILGRKYVDQNKITGIHYDHSLLSTNDTEAIYQRYLKAFKKGVYNYIKEEPNPMTQEMVPRKYFSGGAEMGAAMITTSFTREMDAAEISNLRSSAFASVIIKLDNTRLIQSFSNPAMMSEVTPETIRDFVGNDYQKALDASNTIQRALYDLKGLKSNFWTFLDHMSPEERHKVDIKIAALKMIPMDLDVMKESKQAAWIAADNFYPDILEIATKFLEQLKVENTKPFLNVARWSTSKKYRQIYRDQMEVYNILHQYQKGKEWMTLCALRGDIKYRGQITDTRIFPVLDDITSSDGLTIQRMVSFNRSSFFRSEPARFYNDLERYFKDRVGVLLNQTGTKKNFKVGIMGAAFGQEPISVAIYLDQLSREMGLQGRVKIEVHVFDKPNPVYERAKNNAIIYPELALPDKTARGHQFELSRYFQTRGDGYVRSEVLEGMLKFYDYDMLDPPRSMERLEDFDLFTIHNVLQYLRPQSNPHIDFDRTIEQDLQWIEGLLKPNGVVSVFSSGGVDPRVANPINEVWMQERRLEIAAARVLPGNPAMNSIREADILRLQPKKGENIFIEERIGTLKQKIPFEILSVAQDVGRKELFHLTVLSSASDQRYKYDYDLLKELNTFEFIEGDLAGFKSNEKSVGKILWKQYTNRLYQFYLDKGHSDVSEERKWGLYLRPADRESLYSLARVVKKAAQAFNGPIEFKYIFEREPEKEREPAFEQKLNDLHATKFVINFSSQADALEFYRMLRKDQEYFRAMGLGETLQAQRLDAITSIAQGTPVDENKAMNAVPISPLEVAARLARIRAELRDQVRSRAVLDYSHFESYNKIGEGGAGIVFAPDDSEEFYKIYLHRPESGMRELEILKFLKNVPDVPKVLDWGFTRNGGIRDGKIWIRLKGIKDSRSIRVDVGGVPRPSDIWSNFTFVERLDKLATAAEILNNVHQAGLGHGDVRPLNIIVNDQGRVMIIDWETAKPFGEEVSKYGTKLYTFPESKMHDKSDVLSLAETMRAVLRFPFFRKDVTIPLDNFLKRMENKNLEERPTMEEVAVELRALAKSAATPRSPLGPLGQRIKGKVGNLVQRIKRSVQFSSDKTAGPGGIDLTAKRMDLDVEKDKDIVSQPMDLKMLENIEINGLYIKDIEIKPLNNLPELLGVASS